MKIAVLVMLMVSVVFGEPSLMTKKAKKEGWTFHFSEGNQKFARGLVKPADSVEKILSYEAMDKKDVEIPTVYDLRGKISKIRNQGNCGSCWSFSLTAALLDAWVLSGKDPGALSEQYLVDCAKNQYGCGGGYFNAAEYLKEPKGAPSLAAYPYTAKNGRCKAVPPTAGLIEWHYVGTEGKSPSVKDIQKAILLYGPVSVTVGADSYFMNYQSGVYNACTQQSTNHMTNIVGWNDNEKYWIMRNSWGEEWGEDGYMRIKYVGKNGKLCNRIAEEAVFVKINGNPIPPVVKDYTVDGKTITVKGSLKSNAKYKVEDAKKLTQDMVDALDKE